ncbi:MAG: twin-arginine translocase subunit TatC [Spirochaetales bacterium]|nr:twin-arginine translocase subunit TatC [Spirochaetales bacterium]
MAGTVVMSETVSEEMPLLSHLNELRRCLIISGTALAGGFGISVGLYDLIMDFLFAPLLQLSGEKGENILYINTLAEGFLVRLKISALAGFILSMPVHIFTVLHFVFPGLVKREKQIITVTLICSTALIIGGFFYSYYTIIPVSVLFLTGKGFIPENTGMLLSFERNIFYILQFMLMTLVVFQLPVILEILLVLNVVDRRAMFKAGRYMVVLFFLVSALLTPPDFVTQIGLALPMTVLFYLTILVARIFRFGEG